MSWQHYLLGNKDAHVYTGHQFQCVHCRRSYQSYRTLGNHKCAYCPTCKKIFSTYQKFQMHKTSTCTHNDSQSSRNSKLSSSHTHDTDLETSKLSAPEQTTSVSRASKDAAVSRASKDAAVSRASKDAAVSRASNDVAALVGDGTKEVTDDVVCSALQLMRENNTLCGIQYMGNYTPAKMKLALTSKDATLHKPIVPPDQLFINIHHIPGHWVTSCQQHNHGINVYDSLMSQKHFVDVLQQLQIIYGQDSVSRVKYPVVMQQSIHPICGILAIAFAFTCFLAKDCTQINFDTTVAADHLKNCISMKEINAFPVQSIGNNLFELSIQTYMADQICRKEQNRIRQKRLRERSLSTDESAKQQKQKENNNRQYKRKQISLNETVKQQMREINKQQQQQQKRRRMLDESDKNNIGKKTTSNDTKFLKCIR